MLRITRNGTDDRFEFRGIDRAQVGQVVSSFLSTMREFTVPGGERDARTADPNNHNSGQEYAESRLVPPSAFTIEWQDGNGDWDPAKPTDTITVK